MPNKALTHIAFILDRSGSMAHMQLQTVQSFNAFLESQKAFPGLSRFTLVLFNHNIETVASNIPITEMVPMTMGEFAPEGNTALDDAVGSTIDRLGEEFAKMTEEERPGKVIIAILTDGEENSSARYTTHKVRTMIREQREKYNWQFLFLGASASTEEQARERGIDRKCTRKFKLDSRSLRDSITGLDQDITRLREPTDH